jgi:hypothetical protein
LARNYLGLVALVLMAVVAIGFAMSDPGHQAPAFVAVIAIMVLLELPAVVARMYGASALKTWIVAILLPLVPFELVLWISAVQHQGAGGDLQGIEEYLMVPVAIIVFVTASIVTAIATALIPRENLDY